MTEFSVTTMTVGFWYIHNFDKRRLLENVLLWQISKYSAQLPQACSDSVFDKLNLSSNSETSILSMLLQTVFCVFSFTFCSFVIIVACLFHCHDVSVAQKTRWGQRVWKQQLLLRPNLNGGIFFIKSFELRFVSCASVDRLTCNKGKHYDSAFNVQNRTR